MKRRKKGKSGFVIVILLIIAVLCLGYIIYRLGEYRKGDRIYGELQGTFTIADPEDSKRKQETDEILRKMGSARAWIYCPDTPINYPVMQAEDNQYYLHHLADGTSSACGSVFLDAKNAPDFSDDNSILYGHHMRNGSMFAKIDAYKSETYYREHPVMYLYTREQTYRVELFAGYVMGGKESLPIQFAENQKVEFINKAIRKSTFNGDIQVGENDRILTMITCDYSWNNARFALFGKLIPM